MVLSLLLLGSPTAIPWPIPEGTVHTVNRVARVRLRTQIGQESVEAVVGLSPTWIHVHMRAVVSVFALGIERALLGALPRGPLALEAFFGRRQVTTVLSHIGHQSIVVQRPLQGGLQGRHEHALVEGPLGRLVLLPLGRSLLDTAGALCA